MRLKINLLYQTITKKTSKVLLDFVLFCFARLCSVRVTSMSSVVSQNPNSPHLFIIAGGHLGNFSAASLSGMAAAAAAAAAACSSAGGVGGTMTLSSSTAALAAAAGMTDQVSQ